MMLIKSFYNPDNGTTYHLESEESGKNVTFTISVLYKSKMIILGQYKVSKEDLEAHHVTDDIVLESFLEVFNESKEEKEKLQEAIDRADQSEEDDIINIGDC